MNAKLAFSILSLSKRDDDDDDDDHNDRSRTYGNRPATNTETMIIAIVFGATIILILVGACYYYNCLTCGRDRKAEHADVEKPGRDDVWSNSKEQSNGYRYVKVDDMPPEPIINGSLRLDLFGRR